MRARSSPILFAGPTLAASDRARTLARGLRKRPPVRRHDIAKIVESERPCDIVIVDGVFHDSLAVGHVEIRDAIARGFRLWGLSSMGAIRAREMAPLGMRGFGHVYERFCGNDDFQDDEVALLHEPSPPYRAVSEPLVHLRASIDHLVAQGIVAEGDARDVTRSLKSRWYGERTVPGAVQAIATYARGGRARVAQEWRDFDRFRVKTIDLVRFLELRVWSQTGVDLNV
jgi:hypothetical protein